MRVAAVLCDCAAGVREIRVRDGRFAGAVLEDGSEVSADACIVAVPHNVLLGLLPKEMGEPGGTLEGLRNIRSSPITGVHFWFDRPVMKEPFLTLLDHTTQWVFNKTLLYGETGAAAASTCSWSSARRMIWFRAPGRRSSISAGASLRTFFRRRARPSSKRPR